MVRSLIKNLLAMVLYYSGLIKIIRFFGRNYAKILVFHSISDYESSFVKGANVWTPTAIFAKHLQYIMANYRVISLQTLVESLRHGRVPPRSVVITLDDGFADNYYFAYPNLKRYQIPATIFLVTDCIENKQPIWIQELCYLLNNVGAERIAEALKALKEELDIPLLEEQNKLKQNWKMDKIVGEYLTFDVKKEARHEILARLYRKFEIQREKIFSQNEVFLNWDQVNQMQRDGISFGNHGASHTPFSAMTFEEQKAEIVESKTVIQKKLGNGFLPFAYPFGMARYFTSTTKKIVEDADHSCILTAMATLNGQNTPPNELGRIDVGNIPVHRLAFNIEKALLKKYLHIVSFRSSEV